jgi:hypothetical protein
MIKNIEHTDWNELRAAADRANNPIQCWRKRGNPLHRRCSRQITICDNMSVEKTLKHNPVRQYNVSFVTWCDVVKEPQ